MKTTIDMAREAGFWQEHTNTYMCSTDAIKAFEVFVREDEREACAKLCDWLNGEKRLSPAGCAAAIRARGNT